MRKFLQLHLTLLLLLCLASGANAQKRYLEPIFDQVQVSQPTPVASNYTILPWLFAALNGQVGHTRRQPLVCQFYSPVGDTETNRPLVIYLHTGNFFPYEGNGSCGGTMTDSSNVEIATRLAKMGYVVAVVNYRQGWNPFHPQELVRRYFLINAAYRGVQDVKTYVRYFRRSVSEFGNPHGIDPEKITIWGQGTGGYLSLASAYLNRYNEILTTSDPLKFILPTQAGNIPMVIENYNGNITGTSDITTVDATYNLISTLPVGDTLCVPNHVGPDSDFALAVNMGGALGDSTWVEAGEVPLISFHVPSDAFAPCQTDVLNVPTATGPQPVVEVSGSCDVAKIVDRKGLNNIFNTIPAGNDPYGENNTTGNLGYYAFSNTPANSSSPWEWTFSDKPKPTTDPLVTGCNTDGGSSRLYIDTIIGYFAPRACVALGLNCEFSVSTKDLNDIDVNLTMSPNPASSYVNLRVGKDTPIKAITLMDVSGKVVQRVGRVNASQYELSRNGLPAGLYIVKMEFDNGILNKKVMFN